MDPASREILVEEAVSKLSHFAKMYSIQSLFIVGGYCRDKYFGKIDGISDIDIVSSFEEQAIHLGGLFASEVLHTSPTIYKRSGAASVDYKTDLGTLKIEFQGNSVIPYMHNQEVSNWMNINNIDDVPLMNNIYGRDFTINALVVSLSDGVMYDPTDLAVPDLERKKITSLLPAKMLVKYNPLSILRAIRFALAYDFLIHPDMRTAMKEGVGLLSKSLTEERIVKEIVRILKIDAEKGLEMIQRFKLANFLLIPDIKKYLNEG